MSVELVHSQPTEDTQKRLIRMSIDVFKLGSLSKAEARAVYGELETVRDALSRILDRADGKDA